MYQIFIFMIKIVNIFSTHESLGVIIHEDILFIHQSKITIKIKLNKKYTYKYIIIHFKHSINSIYEDYKIKNANIEESLNVGIKDELDKNIHIIMNDKHILLNEYKIDLITNKDKDQRLLSEFNEKLRLIHKDNYIGTLYSKYLINNKNHLILNFKNGNAQLICKSHYIKIIDNINKQPVNIDGLIEIKSAEVNKLRYINNGEIDIYIHNKKVILTNNEIIISLEMYSTSKFTMNILSKYKDIIEFNNIYIDALVIKEILKDSLDSITSLIGRGFGGISFENKLNNMSIHSIINDYKLNPDNLDLRVETVINNCIIQINKGINIDVYKLLDIKEIVDYICTYNCSECIYIRIKFIDKCCIIHGLDCSLNIKILIIYLVGDINTINVEYINNIDVVNTLTNNEEHIINNIINNWNKFKQ